jgi:all-trans-retinol dehydrogenase (NAD+)
LGEFGDGWLSGSFSASLSFVSLVQTIRTFLPDMITKRSGRVCGVSSLCGVEAQPRMVAYSATKFGVSGLMDGVHEELATMDLENDIITSTVYPYFIATRQDLIDTLKEMP